MNTDRKILIFENTFTLTNFLMKEFGRIVEESVEDHGRCSVALSGGKTPVEFYTRLSQWPQFDLWHKTHIFQADERYVPYDHAENNWRMINETLLNFVPIPEQNTHPIRTNHENILVATEEYKNELVYFFDTKGKQLPRFDLVLLGCGADGHVASIHPGLEGFDEINRLVIPVTTPYFKTERISLTLPVISNARHIVFVAQGQTKAEIVKSVIEDGVDVPATRVKAADGQLSWLIDKFAASKLSAHHRFTDQGEAISI